ncbi:MAG: TIGR00296 family protein [Candidatus Woesearchaeota archaeon]
MFSPEQGRKLVELARKSIETYFSKESIELDDHREFSEKQGVFVSIYKESEESDTTGTGTGKALRGCIGFPEPMHELYRGVFEAARAAAFEDPRFPPMKEEELDEIIIEISVLTVPEKISGSPEEHPEKIEIGSDGLILKGKSGSGLLLPQVPVEWGWDAHEFLKHICIKAGLEQDAWKDPENTLYKFQAQVFAENGPKGEVYEKEM